MNISKYISGIIHIYILYMYNYISTRVLAAPKHVSKTKVGFAMSHPYMHMYWLLELWIYLQLALGYNK